MQNNLIKVLFLSLNFFSVSTYASNCQLATIKTEVSKFHGPEWSKISSQCSQIEIKTHLKKLINNPKESLAEYDTEQQKFIFRNAVKSYGHFGSQTSDLNFLSSIYNDHNHVVNGLFGTDANFFRITILESMANTGNIDALNFFEKILANDHNVLFLQQSALDFSTWILNGSPLLSDEMNTQGSKIYADVFAPNLINSAEKRFKDRPDILAKLAEKKLALKNLLSDMLLNSEYFKPIMPSLLKLQKTLMGNEKERSPSSEVTSIESAVSSFEITQDKIEITDNKQLQTDASSLKHHDRHPATDTENKEEPLLYWISFLLMISLSLIMMLRWKKK